MKKVKGVMLFLVLMTMSVGMLFANGQSDKNDAANAMSVNGISIGVSIADQSNVFYIDILDGMQGAMKDGDRLIAMDAGFDVAKQISDIEDMIQQGVKVMLVDPVDSKAIKASLDACAKAGIPVIAYNSPVDDASAVTSTVASDNYMAGQLIGEELASVLGNQGEIAMLTYNVATVCLDRANGFIDAISKYNKMKIVESQEIQPGVDTALPVMENILQAYPNLTGVFALNDPSAIGSAAAVQSAGLLDQIKIVGVDGSADGKAAIRDGKMLASAAQHPVDIGKISVETAYKIIAGENVQANIKVPVELVTKANAQ
ncbi:ABC-type sugar transport system, periplasmic component [Sphaerochaeta pleomorpha str. Grapes]|uniref:ABC-type sugar transport system, periplasmic component n=1 Tax=Sphaerochaeta pleomorpha (strain ATCC BAA-1885 / DSM 22778 / Grapes) TaxID=158190 RepID=G8QTF5_SPHPG|nr:sugar ABC transporter substrate-binding protein [Sphaerochaeta pleomorpha]AEV30196.1 ABC-type sugar transport system, periplasmic component [Sphaerochaeta pleomorpha str. Grapes]